MPKVLTSPTRQSKAPITDDNYLKAFTCCLKPFRKLTSAGVSGRLLLDYWNKLIIAVLFRSSPPLNIPTAMTRKSLNGALGRIQQIATELEKINNDWHLDPKRWAPVICDISVLNEQSSTGRSKSHPNKDLKRDLRIFKLSELFCELPTLLHLYSEYLSKLLTQIAHHRISHPDETEIRYLTRSLLKEIYESTKGNYYYSYVAAIVDSAYMAAGQKRKITPEWVRGIVRSKAFKQSPK